MQAKQWYFHNLRFMQNSMNSVKVKLASCSVNGENPAHRVDPEVLSVVQVLDGICSMSSFNTVICSAALL